jgi:MFS family permease
MGKAAVPAGRNYVLVLLLLAYIFNFVDRQIIGILAVSIKADLALSDTQLGLLGGLAFAIFYTGLGIPIALAADRWNRVKILSLGLALWSLFTALCGVSQNYWQLFIARMGVGVGEAGGVAPAYSLIADYFPETTRARALAIFACGIPIGSAIGVVAGGWIASHVDWRIAFIVVGLAGLPLALFIRLTVAEPQRVGAVDVPPGLRAVLAVLIRKPSFWCLSFGSAFAAVPLYGLMFWLPSLLRRSFGLELLDLSFYYGSIILLGGIAGLWLGGLAGDRLGARKQAYGLVPAATVLLAAPAYAIAIFAPNLVIGWILLLIPQALAMVYVGPVVAAIQQVVPPAMRATASAIYLLIGNLIGYGLGTVFFGLLSDMMAHSLGTESLRYAILCGLGFYPLSAVAMLLAARKLPSDWEDGSGVTSS